MVPVGQRACARSERIAYDLAGWLEARRERTGVDAPGYIAAL